MQITCFLSGLSCSMTTTQINSLSSKLLRNLNVLFTDWIIRWAHFPDSSSTWECRASLPDFIGPEYISPVVELSKVFGKILSNNEFCDNYNFWVLSKKNCVHFYHHIFLTKSLFGHCHYFHYCDYCHYCITVITVATVNTVTNVIFQCLGMRETAPGSVKTSHPLRSSRQRLETWHSPLRFTNAVFLPAAGR